MKVLYFHHATVMSGAAKSLALLIGKQVADGVEATVAIQRRKGNERVARLFTAAGAQVVEENDIRPFHGSSVAPNQYLRDRIYAVYGYIPLLLCARRLVSELAPDLVHINSTCLVAAGHGAHLARPTLPVVAHVREPILRNAWGGILRRLNRRHVDQFISIDLEGDASLDTPDSSRDIVRNSASSAFFELGEKDRQEALAALGWNDGRLTLLSLSRLASPNGARELAAAIARIETRLPRPVRVVLAGFGPKPETAYEVATRVAIAEGRSCEAMPFLDDIVPAVAGCDAIIAPFVVSHSARSVLEGAAAKRPALVSRLPNLTEMINEGESGISFVPGDDESLLQAIVSICDDNVRTAMGAAAHKLANESFHVDRNAASVRLIYQRLVQIKS